MARKIPTRSAQKMLPYNHGVVGTGKISASGGAGSPNAKSPAISATRSNKGGKASGAFSLRRGGRGR